LLINSGDTDGIMAEETKRTDWTITFSYLLLSLGIV
jgi:hypothetical protein